MDTKFILDKLTNQKNDLKYANLDMWFPTTYSYIEDYFKSYSTRARNFNEIINEYNKKKATSRNTVFGLLEFDLIKSKAGSYLDEIISVINHDYHQGAHCRDVQCDRRPNLGGTPTFSLA